MTQSLLSAETAGFYKDHLRRGLLPFWLDRSPDQERGGFFTCFDNATGQLLSQDKFTWSQGRMVWVWAKLAGMRMFSDAERTHFLALARQGADFLMAHCLLPGGACTFLMNRDGAPKRQAPQAPLDSSIYADCFVILGLSRFAAVSGDRASLDFAHRLYNSVVARIESGRFNTEPYPIPAGYRTHGIPMILLNTSQEMAGGLAACGLTDTASQLMRASDAYLNEIMTHLVTPGGVVHEMADAKSRAENLLTRYVNPGHTLEDMWFVMHQATNLTPLPPSPARRGGSVAPPSPPKEGVREVGVIAQAAQITKRAFELGWDDEFGGLLLFVDQDGGPPRGSLAGIENERMAAKVQADWGSKLWWVHSEALYTALLAWRLTGDDAFLARYRQVADYTFRTFPNPDPAIGEWIQIRDRQGRPEQRVVALPVKDPFHIIRNVALIIELLDKPV